LYFTDENCRLGEGDGGNGEGTKAGDSMLYVIPERPETEGDMFADGYGVVGACARAGGSNETDVEGGVIGIKNLM